MSCSPFVFQGAFRKREATESGSDPLIHHYKHDVDTHCCIQRPLTVCLCSGYLSDPTEGTSVQRRRRVEPRSEGVESNSALKGSSICSFKVVSDHFHPSFFFSACSPEGAGLSSEDLWSTLKREEAVSAVEAEPESPLTSDIMSAMKTFKAHLQQHFTVST